MTRILGIVAIVLGLVAMAGNYVVWNDYRGEFRRMSSELAEMKVSLQLLNQRAPAQASTPVPAPAGNPSQADQIADLKNRMAILENVWRNPTSGTFSAQGAAPLPAVGGEATAPPPGGPKTDCIPLGTRFLLTPNDTYAVCETSESLTLAGVEQGQVELEGLGSVAEGGVVKLGATNCRVAVLSAMADGGFAEVRVTC